MVGTHVACFTIRREEVAFAMEFSLVASGELPLLPFRWVVEATPQQPASPCRLLLFLSSSE
jgi:hypothetical protein